MRRFSCLGVLFLRGLMISKKISRGGPFIRRFLCLIIFFLPGIRIHAQITFEKEYPLENIQYFYVTDSDGVFVNYSIYSSSDTILLFNDNHKLIRIIVPPDDSILSIINVSKYLYNTDDLYELIYVYQAFDNGTRHYNTHVIDENSRLLKSFDNQFMWILPTANGAKLISQGGVKIYSLTGINYPVNKGEQGERGVPGAKGAQGDPGELALRSEFYCPEDPLDMNLNESIFLSEPYPNPSLISSSIDYNISADYYSVSDYVRAFLVFYDITGLQRLSLLLKPSAGSLEITKSLLGTGSFLFRIETENGFSEIRKLIFE
jgi:hypothetical protein